MLIMICQTDLGGKCGKSIVDIKATATRQHIKKYHYTEFMNFNILTRFFFTSVNSLVHVNKILLIMLDLS